MPSLRTIRSASFVALLLVVGSAAAQETGATRDGIDERFNGVNVDYLRRIEIETKLRIAKDAVLDLAVSLATHDRTVARMDVGITERMLKISKELDELYQRQTGKDSDRYRALNLAIIESMRLTKGQM